jgi:SWI/SNF-related matrix-associated actin-dependent regulator 1 of chromatin subfamily A
MQTVLTINRNTSPLRALQLLRKYVSGYDYLTNTVDNRPLTITTENDIIRYEVDELYGLNYAPMLSGDLLQYQKQAIDKLCASNGRSLLALEQGCGKTITAASYAIRNCGRVVVVCPAIMRDIWRSELISKFGIDTRDIETVTGGTPYSTNKRFVIISFNALVIGDIDKDCISRRIERILQTDNSCLIIDETNYINNISAKCTKVCRRLGKTATHCLCLSGTPFKKNIDELYPVVDIICNKGLEHTDDEYVRGRDFYSEYCNDTEGLNAFLTENCNMVRVLKTDVLKNLPNKERVNVSVNMTKQEQEEYSQLSNGVLQIVQNGIQNKFGYVASILVIMQKLRQFCGMLKLNKLIADGTIQQLLNNGKLIVFAENRIILDTLCQSFSRCKKIDGTVTGKARTDNVEQFTYGNCDMLACNIRAAGTGVTLTASSQVLFLQHTWTPAAILQAEDRIHRIGQVNTCKIYNSLVSGTIDESIINRLQSRFELMKDVIDLDNNKDTGFIGESVVDLAGMNLADMTAFLAGK